MATETINASSARKRLFDLMGRTDRLRHRYVLTRDGRPQSVLMSVEEFEEWTETLEVMADRNLVKGIAEGLEDIRRGRVKPYAQVRARLLRAKR